MHPSGERYTTGGITKAGRRDLRSAVVQAARNAAKSDPHWKTELERKEPRMGYQKAIVAIARKLLVAVWHVLTKKTADRFAQPERVARKLALHAYLLGKARRPNGESVPEYVRKNLDNLDLQLQSFKIGKRIVELPDKPVKEGKTAKDRPTVMNKAT